MIIKTKILVLFLLILSSLSQVMAWGIDITAPKWPNNRPQWGTNDNPTYAFPIVTGENPPGHINVVFDVNVGNQKTFYYTVRLIQNGGENYSASSQHTVINGNITATVSIPFSRFCYNTIAEFKVSVTCDQETQHASRYVVVYSQYSSTFCTENAPKAACFNMAYVQQNQNAAVFSLSSECGDQWGSQNVWGYRYKVEFTVYDNFENKTITVNNQMTAGTDLTNPINNCRWAGIKSQTNNQVVFYTFVYYFSLAGGSDYWWPCHYNEAAVAYYVSSGPPPPVISELKQTPGLITQGMQNARMTCILSQGSNVNYSWLSSYRPNYMWDNAQGNGNDFVLISNNYNGLYDIDAYGVYGLKSTVWNSSGSDERSKGVLYSTNGGGCPFLLVENCDSTYIIDNNLMHRSEISLFSSVDYTDFYKLTVEPGIIDDKLNFMIIETALDYNYVDKIGLLAIDHTPGTKIGVTENNQIVTYDPSQIGSSRDAIFNTHENVTKYIVYGDQGDTNVHGDEGDNLSLNMLEAPPSQSGDSLAFIINVGKDEDMIIYPYPAKDYAGTISIYSNGSESPLEIPFARRENNSEVIIPFASVSSVVDSAIIVWDRDFQIDYICIVPITYTGFTSTEHILSYAHYPNDEDAYLKLSDIDQIYVEIDSLYQLSFSFNKVELPDGNFDRSYVFHTTGRYEVPGDGDSQHFMLKQENINNLPFKNKLYSNYPNPFNPVTKINFEISNSNHVKIVIYNLLGQEIRVLVNEFKDAGFYSVDFNGTALPSGLYFYKLETPYFNDVKKMILLK
jgi:hypothetical protein